MKKLVVLVAAVSIAFSLFSQVPKPSIAKPSATPQLQAAHNKVMSLNGTVTVAEVKDFCNYFASLKKVPDSEFTFFSFGQESVTPEEIATLDFESLLNEFFVELVNRENVKVEFHGIEDQSKPINYYHPYVETYFIAKYTIHFKNDNAFGKNQDNSYAFWFNLEDGDLVGSIIQLKRD
jgi:hypothetical protein